MATGLGGSRDQHFHPGVGKTAARHWTTAVQNIGENTLGAVYGTTFDLYFQLSVVIHIKMNHIDFGVSICY